jgi:hypothetical protein
MVRHHDRCPQDPDISYSTDRDPDPGTDGNEPTEQVAKKRWFYRNEKKNVPPGPAGTHQQGTPWTWGKIDTRSAASSLPVTLSCAVQDRSDIGDAIRLTTTGALSPSRSERNIVVRDLGAGKFLMLDWCPLIERSRIRALSAATTFSLAPARQQHNIVDDNLGAILLLPRRLIVP